MNFFAKFIYTIKWLKASGVVLAHEKGWHSLVKQLTGEIVAAPMSFQLKGGGEKIRGATSMISEMRLSRQKTQLVH